MYTHLKNITTGRAPTLEVSPDKEVPTKPTTIPTPQGVTKPTSTVTGLGDLPNGDRTTDQPSISTDRPVKTISDESLADEKLVLLATKISNAHAKPIKRPLIIEQEYDPCIRKKARVQHPSKVAVKPRSTKPASHTDPFDWHKHVSDQEKMDDDSNSNDTIIDLTPDKTPTKSPPKEESHKLPPTADMKIITSDLNVSDSESDPEDGEILDIHVETDTVSPLDSEKSSPSAKPTRSETRQTPPSTSSSATTLKLEEDDNPKEYIPAYVTRKPTHIPDYHPTRRSTREDPRREFNKRPTVPTYQILFDLWRMVRNCDQYIGSEMERAMLHAGYLKPKSK